jgi:tight adherence protein B
VVIGIGVVFFLIPRIALRVLRKRRLRKFNIQLEEALGVVSSSLKAGFSINQALDEVAGQNLHPVSVEFRLLTQEIRLGVPLEQALENMNRRLGSDDFELVATAILTARQTGGELTGTLERVASLIRERVKIANKVHALTAVGRLQAIVISAMPFFLKYMMTRLHPSLMHEFFRSPAGMLSVVGVVVLDILGFLWIRKITAIEV